MSYIWNERKRTVKFILSILKLILKYKGQNSRVVSLRPKISNNISDFGFNFRKLINDDYHVVTNVFPNFPAHESGIRKGDYILEVNGESINQLPHNSVMKKMNSYSDYVDLLIVKNIDIYLMNHHEQKSK